MSVSIHIIIIKIIFSYFYQFSFFPVFFISVFFKVQIKTIKIIIEIIIKKL